MTTSIKEQCDAVCFRLKDLRDEAAEAIREQARQWSRMNKVVARWQLAPLLNEGFKEFSARSLKEYAQSPFLVDVELLIPSHKFFFFANDGLRGDVCKILKLPLPGTSQNK